MTTAPVAISPRDLRNAFSMFPSGVTAVCALGLDGPVGMAASSFTSVSLDPALVSVCVDRNSTTWPKLAAARRIGLSVLGEDQSELCKALAAKGRDRFAGASWQVTDDGAVFLDGATLWLECRVVEALPAGDHEIMLLEVVDITTHPDVRPLVFHQSQLRGLD